MKNELMRAYKMGDAYMFERVNTLHLSFTNNMADFTAMDSTLDATFADEWQDIIDTAGVVLSDSQVIGTQAVKTSDVLDQMELCRKKYTQVKYFVGVAFPDSKVHQNEFRLHHYGDVKRSQALMIKFMEDLGENCQRFSAPLLAVGMTQDQIDEITSIMETLKELNKAQEAYMDARPVISNERIVTYNTCYNTAMRVVNAAQAIYYDNYPMLRVFTFSPTGGSGGGGEDDSIVLTLGIPNDGNSIEVFNAEYLANRPIDVTNNGPEGIEIFIANAPEEGGTPMAVATGQSVSFTANQLGAFGNKIFVRTTSVAVGETSIRVEIGVED